MDNASKTTKKKLLKKKSASLREDKSESSRQEEHELELEPSEPPSHPRRRARSDIFVETFGINRWTRPQPDSATRDSVVIEMSPEADSSLVNEESSVRDNDSYRLKAGLWYKKRRPSVLYVTLVIMACVAVFVLFYLLYVYLSNQLIYYKFAPYENDIK
ncbi:uncharacterized protein LOC106650083 [Trichogramma pretiosum]|uniref:uncharacterized protein LOC106650083 n=1 Tax=Trichogramma pretiosum TaxID=7493 RepID=UPI0006C94FCA|nr:uncharacterized protein LOC106650083 [Trichogramma pretiosum]